MSERLQQKQARQAIDSIVARKFRALLKELLQNGSVNPA
jgi:hypothetical protein